MRTRIITMATIVGLLAGWCAGEVLAAGPGGGRGGRSGAGFSGTGAAGTATTRPAGSPRRDGTFLTAGTTASGATSRPSNGRGLQDGSRLTTTPAP